MGFWSLATRFSARIVVLGWLACFQTLRASPGLDPRVGTNAFLGVDPGVLPANRRAQAEPHVARSPLNPDLLLATFQEGRFTNGGALSCGYSRSTNGGLSWTRSLIPGITRVAGGTFDRATDPVAGFDGLGNAYLCTLGLNGENADHGVVLMSRSTDGGSTFESPREVFRPGTANIFPDKNWFAINPANSGRFAQRLAVTFTQFVDSLSPIAVATSDDQGQTWSPPAFATPPSSACQGSQPLWLPDGTLVVVYWNFGDLRRDDDDSIECVRSMDGGKTFGPALAINPEVVLFDARLVRDGVFLPSAASARGSGAIFVTYQGLDGQGLPRVFVQKSGDGGTHWTLPTAISDNTTWVDPANPAKGRYALGEVFNPAVDVSPDGGRVVIACLDTRVFGFPFVDTFAIESIDGGRTWGEGLRLSRTSTDLRLAPLTATGYMLGDYIGVVAPVDADSAAVVVTMAERAGGIDPLAIRWGVDRGLTFESWRAARWSHGDIQNPSVAGAGSDADQDGIGLHEEYVHGLDPFHADPVGATRLKLTRIGLTELELSFPVRTGAIDVQFQLEQQGASGNWVLLSGFDVMALTAETRRVQTTVSAAAAAGFFRYRVVPAVP